MTTSFKHGTSTYLIVVTPSGMRDSERIAANLQADPALWASGRQKQSALGLRLEDEPPKHKEYVRKNPEQRRAAAKLRMRKLRMERRAT